MYPVDYQLCNLLGRSMDLTVYQFGLSPKDHISWSAESLKHIKKNFKMKLFGGQTDSLTSQLDLRFLNELKKDDPDIILSVAFWVPSLISAVIKEVFKFKLIIVTDAIHATDSMRFNIRYVFRRVISDKADKLIAASPLTKLYLYKFANPNKIELSMATIDTLSWRREIVDLPNKICLRKKLSLPIDKVILLGVGNFIVKKNWTSVLKCMKKVGRTIFVLIGQGSQKDQYISYIKHFGLEDKVIIVGEKQGIALKEYYKASDLFILPSLYDQFGFVVVEALCSDLPVLCSNRAGSSCLIHEGENGYLIDPYCDYSQCIENAIEKMSEMQKNAYESIKNLTLENRAMQFYRTFKSLVC
jgi:glycosyltransferase involved in cell wall biosynthesis